MHNPFSTQRLKSLTLLTMYLLILATSGLHIHESGHESVECKDCKSHVKHNGHISQASVMGLDCVLCQVIHSSYITPEVLTFSAAALLIFVFTLPTTPEVVYRTVTLPELRAPPIVALS